MTVTVLDCWAAGTAVQQGSKTMIRDGQGHGVGMREDAATRLGPWRDNVRRVAEAERLLAEPADYPVRVDLKFYFARPKSRGRATWHSVKPDPDKLARAVLDALTDARVLRDDSRVADLRVRKRYVRFGDPGVQILVAALGDDETD